MKYKVTSIPNFDRQFKKLHKKYPSLKKDLKNLAIQLQTTPKLGTPLGNNCYKIRFAISSKSRGKSGGGRIITHLIIAEKEIVLLSIFDKSQIDTISDKELKNLLKDIS